MGDDIMTIMASGNRRLKVAAIAAALLWNLGIRSALAAPAGPAAADIGRSPAYELLSALDLLEVSARDGLRVGPPQPRSDGSHIVRITLDEGPCPDMISARGLNILPVEMGNTKVFCLRSFDLLYNGQDRLIAVFPVFPETAKPRSREEWVALQPKYFDLSPYYMEVPGSQDPSWSAEWRAFAALHEGDQKRIDAFLRESHRSLSEAFPEFLRPAFPYRFHELDALTGDWTVEDFSPLVFLDTPPAGRILTSMEPGDFLRKFDREPAGKHRLIIPTFPTVYALANMTPDELEYLRGVYKRFQLGPNAKILVVGPGTGVDTWIASFRTKQPIRVIGINPLEVANTRVTAKLAGLEVRTLVGDNVADERGEPRFPGERFDAVFWSMPAVWDAPPPGPNPPSFTDFWDGDIGGGILERLAKALPKLLEPGGVAFLWNYAPMMDGRNMVAATLETAGTGRKVFDVKVEKFVKRSRPPQEWFKGQLYTVTWPQ
ncbi:MAG: hypothetical protein A2X36_12800 [Elusimicrobia bacterium GWA2_69_24]|nr:MAG: hypothetical protein A2X36_12800 [Elusimicrobia bacterium GWA2_69_24]